jgi:hypothetical protein
MFAIFTRYYVRLIEKSLCLAVSARGVISIRHARNDGGHGPNVDIWSIKVIYIYMTNFQCDNMRTCQAIFFFVFELY